MSSSLLPSIIIRILFLPEKLILQGSTINTGTSMAFVSLIDCGYDSFSDNIPNNDFLDRVSLHLSNGCNRLTEYSNDVSQPMDVLVLFYSPTIHYVA